MAKLALTFDLDHPESPDDLNDALLALYGPAYANVILEIDIWLRGLEKNNGKTEISIQQVRERLREETAGLPGIWLD